MIVSFQCAIYTLFHPINTNKPLFHPMKENGLLWNEYTSWYYAFSFGQSWITICVFISTNLINLDCIRKTGIISKNFNKIKLYFQKSVLNFTTQGKVHQPYHDADHWVSSPLRNDFIPGNTFTLTKEKMSQRTEFQRHIKSNWAATLMGKFSAS